MKKIILMLVIIVFVFSIWGCIPRQQSKQKTDRGIRKEEATQKVVEFLNEKYGTEHIVTDLYLQGGTPFATSGYHKGNAYRINDPDKVFEVYITDDGKEIRDNYYGFQVSERVNELYKNIGGSIWEQIDFSIDVARGYNHQDWDENANLVEYLSKESPMIYAMMYINVDKYNEASEVDNIYNFINELSESNLYGRLDFSFVSTKNFSETVNEINALDSYKKRINSDLLEKRVFIEFDKGKTPNYEEVKNAFESK
jgi:hypothetical protein